MNQRDADFFRPLWRRVVVTSVVAAWFGYEVLFSKDQMWITITAVGLAYCVWNLLLRFPKDTPATSPGTPPGTTGDGTGPVASSGTPDSNSDSAPKA